MTYIGNNFGKKFDYFFKADDDTYVVVENLRKLLSTYNPEVPFILGYKHAVSSGLLFCHCLYVHE